MDGHLNGAEIRQSLGTCDWPKAQDLVREWEAKASKPKATQEPTTIQAAADKFLDDIKGQDLAEATIYKYRLLFKQMREFSQKRGLRYPTELNLEVLDYFRAGWKDGPRSSAKKLERLRAFFRFAQGRDGLHRIRRAS